MIILTGKKSKLKFFLALSIVLSTIFLGLYISEIKQRNKFRSEFELLVASFNGSKQEKEDLLSRQEELIYDYKQVKGLNNKNIMQKKELTDKNQKLMKTLFERDKMLENLRLSLADKEQQILQLKRQLNEDISTVDLNEQVQSDGIDSNKTRSLIFYNVGVILSGSSMFDKAIDAYKMAIEYDAKNFDAHYNLAMLLLHSKKNNDLALNHLQTYIKYNPQAKDSDEILFTIGKLQAKQWINEKLTSIVGN